MFVFSLIPYLSIFTADYPNSLLPQVLYGLDFIIVDIILLLLPEVWLRLIQKISI